MNVGFPQTGGGDAHKAGPLLEFFDRGATAVTHPGTESPDELRDHFGEQALVRDAAFDALWDEFGNLALLRVAVAGARGHGGD